MEIDARTLDADEFEWFLHRRNFICIFPLLSVDEHFTSDFSALEFAPFTRLCVLCVISKYLEPTRVWHRDSEENNYLQRGSSFSQIKLTWRRSRT